MVHLAALLAGLGCLVVRLSLAVAVLLQLEQQPHLLLCRLALSRLASLDRVDFLLVRMRAQAAHIGAVTRDGAGSALVIARLHRFEDRATQIIIVGK